MAGGQYTATSNSANPNLQAPSGFGGMLGGMAGNLFNQLQAQGAMQPINTVTGQPSLAQPTLQPIGITGAPDTTNPLYKGAVTPPPSNVQLLPSTPIDISSGSGDSKIDPALRPFLTEGLRQAQNLFLGANQPRYYEGQTYVSPSQATQDALATQEAMARAGSPILQQAQGAYQGALGGLGFTGAGGFLQGNPFQQAAMQAATRPIEQQFSNQVLPSIASLYSKSGRYGSGAMQNALSQATEAQTRALGDITGSMANQQYLTERGLQQQALGQQAQLAAAAPSIYSQQYLPSQQLAQIGAAQEQIAQLPLQESMNRYYFNQQLPAQQLQSYLSSIYATPMSSSQFAPQPQASSSRVGSVLGGAGLGYGIGNMIGGSGLFGTSAGTTGAVLGGLGGLLI
jgi:hypothetical protein